MAKYIGQRNLLRILQRFGHLSINSDSIDKKRFGFGEEFNQTCYLLQEKHTMIFFSKRTITQIL